MRSRKVKPVKTGIAAEAFVFCNFKSRIFVTRPPKEAAEEPKLLAWVLSKISVLAAVAVKVEAPVIFKMPLCDNCPPTVTPKVPLMTEAPKTKALVSVTATLLPLEKSSVVKLLAEFSVMLFPALAPIVAVAPAPFTMMAPDWVIAPVLAKVKLPAV